MNIYFLNLREPKEEMDELVKELKAVYQETYLNQPHYESEPLRFVESEDDIKFDSVTEH